MEKLRERLSMERAAVAQNRMLREWLAANRVAVGRLWADLGFVSAPH